MRLPAEKIKEQILSPDRDVRDAAVFYFARSHSDDPTIMPVVLEACQRYGSAAFERYSFLRDLPQTESSVGWIVQQIESAQSDEDRGEFFLSSLASGLRHADVEALEPYEAKIRQLPNLDYDAKASIEHRLAISSFTPDQLWKELNSFCESQDKEDDAEKGDVDFGFALADTLARYPEACAEQVLEIVRRKGEDWQEILAVRMAGRLRLEALVPELLDLTSDCDTWIFGEALDALTRIGTNAVVEQVAARYPTADHWQRMSFAGLLESIHSDFSVQTSSDLLEIEKDSELRRHLIRSLLLNFSTAGIEPARQHVLAHQKTPELLEVRQALLVASKMLGVHFLEFDAWLADSQTDVEFRQQWYESHPLVRLADLFNQDEVFEGDDFDADFQEEPVGTIIRAESKVGRNDPCPCGSGKKYKKCCIHKRVSQ